MALNLLDETKNKSHYAQSEQYHIDVRKVIVCDNISTSMIALIDRYHWLHVNMV